MSNFQLVKKHIFFCKNSISDNYMTDFTQQYKIRFKSYRYDNTQVVINYLKGLLSCPKGEASMERMEELVADSS